MEQHDTRHKYPAGRLGFTKHIRKPYLLHRINASEWQRSFQPLRSLSFGAAIQVTFVPAPPVNFLPLLQPARFLQLPKQKRLRYLRVTSRGHN